MAPTRFTFIYNTPKNHGSFSKSLAQINSHIAFHTHATRRLPSPPEEEGALVNPRSKHGQVTECQSDDSEDPLWIWYLACHNLKQIHSSLDPFIKLPIELTDGERNLLQSYLVIDRRIQLGTSQNPAYCPSLETAKKLMTVCPVYVLTHLVAAHMMQSARTGIMAAPTSYFRRRAEAYKAMNNLLSQPEVSFDLIIAGLIHISVMEFCLGSPDLRVMHVRALAQFVEANGGLSLFLTPDSHLKETAIHPVYYAGSFISIDFQHPRLGDLETTQFHFTQILRRIGDWATSLQYRMFLSNNASGSTTTTNYSQTWSANRLLLQPLTTYVHGLIEAGCKDQAALYSYQTAAAFFFLVVLCMFMVEGSHDEITTLEFLHRSQQCMQSSTSSPPDASNVLSELKPQPAAKMLSHVRHTLMPNSGAALLEETKVAQAAIDAQKAFCLIPGSARRQLMVNLARCAFVVAEPVGGLVWDEESFDQLQTYMFTSWAREQGGQVKEVYE